MRLTCLSEADIDLQRSRRQDLGDIAAQIRLLAAKVRVGQLDPKRVTTAAALGDPAAGTFGFVDERLFSAIRLISVPNKIIRSIKYSNLSEDDIKRFLLNCVEQTLYNNPKARQYALIRDVVRILKNTDEFSRISAGGWGNLRGRLASIAHATEDADLESFINFLILSINELDGPIENEISSLLFIRAINAGLDEEWAVQKLVDYLLDRI